jgi:translation elongation factor EF-G
MQWPLQQLVSDPGAASQHEAAHELKLIVPTGEDVAVRPTQAGLLVLGTSELALERSVEALLTVRPGLSVGKPQINYIPGEVWLEPVCLVVVDVPTTAALLVSADLRARRAQVRSTRTVGTRALVEAEIPMAELFGYFTSLRSIAQAPASYEARFIGYKPSDPSNGGAVVA